MTVDSGYAVLWDLDGTIMDSEEFHWKAWRRFSEGQGKPMTLEFVNETFGFRNEIILRRHFGDQLTDAEVFALSGSKEALYRDFLLQAEVKPLPGVAAWLNAFRARGWRQGLASMAPRENITVALAALGIRDYFDAIVSGEDVRHGKPDPQVFLAAAQLLGVPPERCVVIEDSAQGVEAARRAGMKRIAVGPEASKLGADLAFVSLATADSAVAARLLVKDQES